MDVLVHICINFIKKPSCTDDGLVYTRAHPYILGNRRMALFLGLYSRASAESLMQRTETAMLPIRAYPAA